MYLFIIFLLCNITILKWILNLLTLNLFLYFLFVSNYLSTTRNKNESVMRIKLFKLIRILKNYSAN